MPTYWNEIFLLQRTCIYTVIVLSRCYFMLHTSENSAAEIGEGHIGNGKIHSDTRQYNFSWCHLFLVLWSSKEILQYWIHEICIPQLFSEQTIYMNLENFISFYYNFYWIFHLTCSIERFLKNYFILISWDISCTSFILLISLR